MVSIPNNSIPSLLHSLMKMRFSLAFTCALAGFICGVYLDGATAQATKSPLTSLPLAVSADESFNFQLLILLGSVRYAAADAAEVLAAARVIKPGSFLSFNTTFYELANATRATAEKAWVAGNPVNARDSYFAAASYFRSADFYLHGNWSDPLINEYWIQQTECFDKAIAALPVPGERVTIPANGFNTVGIFYAVDNSSMKRPTLLLGNGYDEAQEDSYHQVGAAALERGWNVMTYEGPGQPTVRRDQGLGFIPDWERVVTPAVDYLANRSDVDMSRLALAGISMGGYLAARAAAFEPRIKALILDDGVFDVQASFTISFPPQLLALYNSGNQSAFDAIVDAAVINNKSAPSTDRWIFDQGLWSFKTHSPYDLLQLTKPYTLINITDLIHIPVWVGNAADDTEFPGQAVQVARALGTKATLHNFTGPASYHCQAGAFETANVAIFGWLGEVFRVVNGSAGS